MKFLLNTLIFLLLLPMPSYATTYDEIYEQISKTLDKDPFFSCQQQVHDFISNKIDFSNDNDPYLKKLDQVSCACNMWAREYNTVFNLEKNHKEIKTFLEKCLSLSDSIDL